MFSGSFCTCSGSPVETFTATGTWPFVEQIHSHQHFASAIVEPGLIVVVDTIAITEGIMIVTIGLALNSSNLVAYCMALG